MTLQRRLGNSSDRSWRSAGITASYGAVEWTSEIWVTSMLSVVFVKIDTAALCLPISQHLYLALLCLNLCVSDEGREAVFRFDKLEAANYFSVCDFCAIALPGRCAGGQNPEIAAARIAQNMLARGCWAAVVFSYRCFVR